jgi:hypothetical protein
MRFSLRTLLGAVTAAAIALAVLVYLTVDYRKQLAIRSDLTTMGAYSVRFGPGNAIHASFHDPVASPAIAKYHEVAVLDFKEAHVTEESLKNLSGLASVDVIVFSLSDVRDEHLLELKTLGKVRNLVLSHTGLTDGCVDALIDVSGLESVDVTNSLITESGIDRLHEARPSLVVRHR